MALKPEEIAHINIVNWFNYHFPELADDFHHFANERFLDVKKNPSLWATAHKLSRMNVKKGVPDFFLAVPLDGYHGFWLELKVGKNKLSSDQKAFIKRKMERGYLCAATTGVEDSKEAILTYLRNYKTISDEKELKNCII